MSGPNDEEGKPTKRGSPTIQALASGNPTNVPNAGAPRRPIRRGNGPSSSNRAGGSRGIARNRSGPTLQSRGLPKRGVARNRSGPLVRTVARNRSGPRRGITRTASKTRALPLKTNSFQRSVPEQGSTSSSLRKYRRQPAATSAGHQVAAGTPCIRETQRAAGGSTPSNRTEDDGDGDGDAKDKDKDGHDDRDQSQVSHIPAELSTRQLKLDDLSVATSDLDNSLRTMDSMMFHKKHVDEGGFTDDMSAFDESFVSTDTYLDDYGGDDGDDFEGSSSAPKLDVKMRGMKIVGGTKSDADGRTRSDEELDDYLEEGDLK